MNRIRNAKISKRILPFLLLVVSILSATWGITAQTANATAISGTIATTLYERAVIGADGKDYKIYGSSENVIFDKEGVLGYAAIFNSNLAMRYFQLKEKENKDIHTGFCVEWGRSYSAGVDYSAMSSETDYYFTKLRYWMREGITLAALYGYQPGRPVPVIGANEDDFYAATQVIIWEYQQMLRTSPSQIQGRSGMPYDYFYKSIKGRPAEICYNYILGKIAKHKTIPSFANDITHVLKYNPTSGSYSATLTDTNGIEFIPRFKHDNISVEKKGNDYVFIANKPLEELTLYCYPSISLPEGYNLIWGTRQTGQVLMTGTSDSFYYTIKLRTEKNGVCAIRKTSEDGNVEGIEFIISGNNIDPIKAKTDRNGKLDVDLIPGKYTVKEVINPKYIDIGHVNVIIEEGKTTNVPFNNQLSFGKIKITKKDFADSETNIPNCGIEILDEKKTVVLSGRTDENGIVEFNNLKYGKYFYREFDAPKGYEIDKTAYPFEIKGHGEVIQSVMTNKKLPNSVIPTPPEPIITPPEPSPESPVITTNDKPMSTEYSATLPVSVPKTGDKSMFFVWGGVIISALILTIFSLMHAKK